DSQQIGAADFFVVPTATCRLLFVLVILAHERRRVVHVAVTEHPTAAWTIQQLRDAFRMEEGHVTEDPMMNEDSPAIDEDLSFAKIRVAPAGDCFRKPRQHKIGRVLEMIVVLVRGLALACRGHHELVLENLALRQQVLALKRSGPRPRVRRRDRLFWIALAATWQRWRTALVFVQPDTVMRWHRELLRRRWLSRSRSGGVGRPRTIGAEIHALVRRMAAANPLWGAPRIHGELRILGIDISERTVSRLLARGDRRPSPQTWRTFLANHLSAVTSMDFFT